MNQESQASIGELFNFIFRGLLVALPIALLAAAAAFLLSQQLDPVYEASTTLLAAEPNTSGSNAILTPPPIEASAYATVVISNPVLTDAFAQLGQTNPSGRDLTALRKNLSVSIDGGRNDVSSLIYLTAAAPSAENAAAYSDAVSRALVQWDRARASANIDQHINTLEGQIEALDESIESLRLMGDVGNQNEIESRTSLRAQQQEELFYARALRNSTAGLLSVVEPAVVPPNPAAPQPVRNAALAAVLSIFLVYGVLLLRNALDSRLRRVEDVAAVGLPILAEVPKVSKSRRLSPEAMSFLRTNLLFAAQEGPRVFLVSSAQQAEGKSSVALNLAESFARNDYRTLLVDADMRKPVVADEYHIAASGRKQLQDFLKNPTLDIGDETTQIAISQTQNLDVVPTFEATSAAPELLSSGMRACLERWRERYDVIVIDSAPLLPVADSLTIAPFCTGTVLVASLSGTDRRSLQVAAERLQNIGVRVLGAVVTQVGRASVQSYAYGYGETQQPRHKPGISLGPTRKQDVR